MRVNQQSLVYLGGFLAADEARTLGQTADDQQCRHGCKARDA